MQELRPVLPGDAGAVVRQLDRLIGLNGLESRQRLQFLHGAVAGLARDNTHFPQYLLDHEALGSQVLSDLFGRCVARKCDYPSTRGCRGWSRHGQGAWCFENPNKDQSKGCPEMDGPVWQRFLHKAVLGLHRSAVNLNFSYFY